MDDESRQEFRIKFMILTFILNAIILLFALAIVAFFRLDAVFNLPVSLILAVPAALLSIYFWRAYKREKAWLAAQE